jgi:hypothetical protein
MARPTPASAALLVVAATLLGACTRKAAPVGVGARARSAPSAVPARSAEPHVGGVARGGAGAATPAAARPVGPRRFVAIGGGATPESTEVSLEQDIALVQGTLPAPGETLFAGGSGSLSVRELDAEPHGDVVRTALGDLFHPRNGRSSRYRTPRFDAERATVENVEAALASALDEGGAPLLLYIAAHGDQGTTAKDNFVVLWGGRPLTVTRVAELSEQHPRALRMVVTSCYSGGFGELAFAHADEHSGPSRTPRCGLFAGTSDRQTSGCDANPDRRAQESYGLHFIHALAKTDREGKPLAPELVDFDHDGKVGLLDAHTRARIAAVSIDVPTTTSERFLRSVEPASGALATELLPEDAAVVEQLGAALQLRDESQVERRWTIVERKLDDLDEEMDRAEDTLAVRDAALSSRLLEQWPVLDDAFHPDFQATLERHRDAIRATLESSHEATARNDARAKVDEIDEAMDELEVEEARVLRLKRAYETLHRAGALLHRSSSAARYYRTLLECERGVP